MFRVLNYLEFYLPWLTMSIVPSNLLQKRDVAAATSSSSSSACVSVSICGGENCASAASVDVEDADAFILLDGSRRRRPPIVPVLFPYRVSLEVGREYRWCACGRSADQPFCDDSHTDSDPQPLTLIVDVRQANWLLCGCKYTSKPPFCDGSHIHVEEGMEERQVRNET